MFRKGELVVEIEEGRSHRAEELLAAGQVAPRVGHGLVRCVELVDRGRERQVPVPDGRLIEHVRSMVDPAGDVKLFRAGS